MYLGMIVEIADAETLFARPSHPYTQALLSAIPLPDPVAQRARQRIILTGELPSPANVPPGCPFTSRCPLKIAVQREAPAAPARPDRHGCRLLGAQPDRGSMSPQDLDQAMGRRRQDAKSRAQSSNWREAQGSLSDSVLRVGRR